MSDALPGSRLQCRRVLNDEECGRVQPDQCGKAGQHAAGTASERGGASMSSLRMRHVGRRRNEDSVRCSKKPGSHRLNSIGEAAKNGGMLQIRYPMPVPMPTLKSGFRSPHHARKCVTSVTVSIPNPAPISIATQILAMPFNGSSARKAAAPDAPSPTRRRMPGEGQNVVRGVK